MKNQNCVRRLVHENELLLFHWSDAKAWASACAVPDDSQVQVTLCQNWKLPCTVRAVCNSGNFLGWAHWSFAVSRTVPHILHKHIHRVASGSLMASFSLGSSVLEFNLSIFSLEPDDFFGDYSCVLSTLVFLSKGLRRKSRFPYLWIPIEHSARLVIHWSVCFPVLILIGTIWWTWRGKEKSTNTVYSTTRP